MYTEEPRSSINWGEIIKKGIIILAVALVIFFVIWLLTRNNQGVNVNYDSGNGSNNGNNTNVTETLPNNAYSKAFLEGYRYFHDTSKEYFLVSELPTAGHTLKYTLQELINKGLLFAWEYKDGKTCDTEASYAYVTNNNGKYKLTINLVCGLEVGKTTEDLGCNQLCTNGNCNNPDTPDEYIIEYKFRQAYTDYETVYNCPAGYTKDGTKCIKDNSTTIKATKKVTYSCPSGYKAIGAGADMKCQKGTSETVDATKTTTYTCPNGYIKSGSGESTKCYKTDSKYVAALFTTTTNCPDGFTPNGNSCVKTTTIEATIEATYGCPDGYSQNGSNCTKTVTIDATPNTKYSCPNGYSPSGSNCVKTTTVNATYKESKTCPDGYSLKGNSCIKETTTTPSTSVTYNCPSGYSKTGTGAATKCTKSVTIDATPTTYYKCSEGELINTNKCRVTVKEHYIETPANVQYPTYNGCKWAGYYENECSNGKCTAGVNKYLCPASTVTKNATAYTKYTCPKGYAQNGTNGTKCTGTETINATATTNYNCPAGYTKSGSGASTKCSKTVSTNATVKSSYTCSNDYSLNGTKCSKTETINANTNTTYTCPNGYSQNGSSCSKTYSTSADYIYNYKCPSDYDLVNNKCTKTVYGSLTTTKNYYCENPEHILSGDKCYYNYNDEVKPTVSYSTNCPKGYTQNGDKCTYDTTEIKNAVINTSYTCPSGYTKVGYGSQTKCTKGATTSIDATKTTQKVTKYRYKWSSESSLAGWEKTKETKTTKIDSKDEK